MTTNLQPNQAKTLTWVSVLLILGSVAMVFSLWVPLLLAAWASSLSAPLMRRLAPLVRGRHSAAAALVSLLLLVLIIPIGLLVLAVGIGVMDLVSAVSKSAGARAALEAIVSGGDQGSTPALSAMSLDFQRVIQMAREYGERAWQVLGVIAGATAQGMLATFVFVVGAYSFLVDGTRLYARAMSYLPVVPRHAARMAAAFHETGRALIIGMALTAFAQGALATITFVLLGVPRAFALGLVTCFAAFIPSVGTALVWIPVAIGLALTGKTVSAAILVGVGIGVIGAVDNILRPYLSRHARLDLQTFVLMTAMLGGLAIVGAWGLLLGPLLFRLMVEVLRICKEEGVFATSSAEDHEAETEQCVRNSINPPETGPEAT